MVTAEPSAALVEAPPRELWETMPQLFPLRLQLPSEWALTDACFLELCRLNDNWRIESDAEGGLLIMAPAGTESGRREVDIAAQLVNHCLSTGVGQTYGPSSLFQLPNGERRAADSSWISDERLLEMTAGDEGVWAVCPDFVVEVRSVNDALEQQQTKMEMWIAQGARLGWLVDPFEEAVWIYRPQREAERVLRPLALTAVEIAADLTIDFTRIWRTREESDA